MADFETLKVDIQRHLNDRTGNKFTDDSEFVTALVDALREIALIRDPRSSRELFKPEFMAAMSKTEDVEVSEEGTINLPDDSLRIIGGRIGSANIEAVKGLDYELKNNESVSTPTLGNPWLVSNGSSSVWEVWPVGNWAGFTGTIRYVTDPPPYVSAHPAIIRAMTLIAARSMALDNEMPQLGAMLQQRADMSLSMALGVNLSQPATENG